MVDSVTPTVSSSQTYPDTYTFALVDLSIPDYLIDTDDPSSLVPGVGPNRTTRLHWWQDDVTQGSDGEFSSSSADLAPYQGPMPPAGDEPHDYVLYLFDAAGLVPPPNAEAFYDDTTVDNRMNFSVQAIVDQVGAPLAARYFTVQNTGSD